jgi:hypothetical protein
MISLGKFHVISHIAVKQIHHAPIVVVNGSGSWEGKLSNPRGRAARAIQKYFFENLRNPARDRRAGAMRQFPSGQLDSMHTYVHTKF